MLTDLFSFKSIIMRNPKEILDVYLKIFNIIYDMKVPDKAIPNIITVMQQYAEEYHQSELLKLNKSDDSGSVCEHSWFPTTKGYKRAWKCSKCKKVVHDKNLR